MSSLLPVHATKVPTDFVLAGGADAGAPLAPLAEVALTGAVGFVLVVVLETPLGGVAGPDVAVFPEVVFPVAAFPVAAFPVVVPHVVPVVVPREASLEAAEAPGVAAPLVGAATVAAAELLLDCAPLDPLLVESPQPPSAAFKPTHNTNRQASRLEYLSPVFCIMSIGICA